MYVPLALIPIMRSNLLGSVAAVPVKLMALALLIRISIPPNLSAASFMADWMAPSFLISTAQARHFPPASSTKFDQSRNCIQNLFEIVV